MAIVYSDDPNWMEYLNFIYDVEDDDQFEDRVIYLPWTDEGIHDNGIECLCKAHEAEVERRRKVRRRMKADKRIMHKKEADWERETQVRKEQGQRVQCMEVNFHRPSGHERWDPDGVPTIQVRRVMRGMDQQLCELSLLAATECESTCVVVAMPPRIQPTPRVVAQKRIRPGGRVERLERERMEEDAANAAEFAKAISQMSITRMMLREQKGDNV